MNLPHFKSGKAIFYSLRYVNISKSLFYNHRECHLSEDLLYVKYPNNYTLDVGWYGDYSKPKSGFFKIVIIKDENWEKAEYSLVFKDIRLLKKSLLSCIEYVSKASSSKFCTKTFKKKFLKQRLFKTKSAYNSYTYFGYNGILV